VKKSELGVERRGARERIKNARPRPLRRVGERDESSHRRQLNAERALEFD
jgi:hypothetical protein